MSHYLVNLLQGWFGISIGKHPYLMCLHIEDLQTIMARAEENEEHHRINVFKDMQTPFISYFIAFLENQFDSNVG